MKNAKDIKKRIKSVNNISKVTKTMELISASRKKKMEQKILDTQPYNDALHTIFKRVELTHLKGLEEHELLKSHKEVKNIAVVVIGPTKGYVGNMVSHQILDLIDKVEKIKEKHNGADIKGVSINKVGLKITRLSGIKDKYHFSDLSEYPHYIELAPIYEVLKTGFISETYDEIYLSYTDKKPIFVQLLPLQLEQLIKLANNISIETNEVGFEKNTGEFRVNTPNKQNTNLTTYKELYEPEAFTVVDYVLNEYFENIILRALLLNNVTEHSSRMVTMHNASDNAHSLGESLQMNYNKTRQAQITEEIIEVTR